MTRSYYTPRGGLPAQHEQLYDPARFTTAYAVIPAACMTDIVTSALPGWTGARAWIIARPLSGFAESFCQMIVELSAGGSAPQPETDAGAEGVIFVTDGVLTLTLDGQDHELDAGGYAFLAPGADWSLKNAGEATTSFHWVRKRYQPAPGIAAPASFVSHDDDKPAHVMSNTDKWVTTRFVEPDDLRHDMHVNIVTFQPGGRIPFAETHVMEHGLYVLQGRGRYLLNTDWVDVGPGDYMWLRAFCPQACEQVGDEPFRYLLYKDVNRLPGLTL